VSYQELTVEQLKDELRDRDLPVSGNKDELVARLEEDDAGQGAEALDPAVRVAIALEEIACNTADILAQLERMEGPGPHEEHPTEVKVETPDRDELRDVARRLLTAQPDGRARALNVLGQFGGSVSEVPEDDVSKCLTALQFELEAVGS